METFNQIIHWYSSVANQDWFKVTVDTLTIIILAITALVTRLSQKATSEANILKLLPLLVICHSYRDSSHFEIKNLGEGTAYDIKIVSWILIFRDVHEILEFTLKVKGTNVLTKGEAITLHTAITNNGEDSHIGTDFGHAMMKGNSADILIIFKDVTGKTWITRNQISYEGITIKDPPHRLTTMDRLSLWYGLRIQRKFKIWIEQQFWKYEERTLSPIPNSYFVRLGNILVKKFKER